MAGHDRPESAVTMRQNTHPAQASPQQNLQERPAEPVRNPRTTMDWFEHRNRSSRVPQQLGEQNADPGLPTPTSSKRTSEQAHLPASPRQASEQRTEPQEPGKSSFPDSRSSLPQAIHASQYLPLNPGSPPHELMNSDTAGAIIPSVDHHEQNIFALLAQGLDEVDQFIDQYG
jgi:hypothetical protein